jgi:threonyl-tRNA synthetase
LTCRRSLVRFQYRPPFPFRERATEKMAEIILQDGRKVKADGKKTYADILADLPIDGLERIVAVKIDGKLRDLRHTAGEGGRLEPVSQGSEQALEVLRHSTSHLMALAVQELYKDVAFAIGPSIDEGFYYDFLLPSTITPADLERIESRMREILERDSLCFEREVMPRGDAIRLFEGLGQKFKVELLEEMDEETVTLYRLGSFVDLCRGPHVPDLSLIHSFKLTSLAGAYWRGDERREMLQRLYGTAFYTDDGLAEELNRREEAKRRDHRRLGPELELFDIKEEIGGGLVLWYPKGYVLREIIENFWKEEHRKAGYEIVLTPHIARSGLWKTSGHYDFYRDNMFVIPGEDQEFVLKPMNCPAHIVIFKRRLHSYRDLPVRYAELGTVYRNERSGTLHGLLRVRGFTQDDAHIFCTPEQLMDEVGSTYDFAHMLLTTFGFSDYKVELSVHDPEHMDKYAGTEKEWRMAEDSLQKALEKRGIDYRRIVGEAVFYGPKIDIKLIDAIGRGWQATTIQFDFNLPRRFDVEYVTPEGKREYVYMIHRALFGSLERFIGTLTEHYAGEFPLWLAPVQVLVLPISHQHHAYAATCVDRIREARLRVEGDFREEKIGYKIREAELQKIPYMVVVGEREAGEGTVDVRSKSRGRLGAKKIDAFISELVDENGKRT